MLDRRNRIPSSIIKKKKKRALIAILLIILNVIVFGVIFSLFSHQNYFKIEKIEVVGNISINENDIINTASKLLEGDYIYFWHKDNSIIYPKSSIIFSLKDSFPKIETADISVYKFKTLKISILERSAVALWCDDSECFYIDKGGMIFSKSADYSGNIFLKFKGELFTRDENVELVKDDSPIWKNYQIKYSIADIIAFVDDLRGLNLNVENFIREKDGNIILQLIGGGKVLFNDKIDLKKVFNNLNSTFSNNDSGLKDKIDKINYIDLRYGNKIFYRLK